MDAVSRIRDVVAEDDTKPGNREWIGVPAADVVAACEALPDRDARVEGLRATCASKKLGADALVRKADLLHLLEVTKG